MCNGQTRARGCNRLNVLLLVVTGLETMYSYEIEWSKLLKGRGDKVSSKTRSRGGTKRCLKEDREGTLRTKIPWLSTEYTAYIVSSSGGKGISGIPRSIFSKSVWKTEEFVRVILIDLFLIDDSSLFKRNSRRVLILTFFFPPPKMCASWKNSSLNDASRNRVNSMIDQWPLLSDLYPAYSEIADILLTASRPIVPRSMNRFANAFPFRRRELDWQSVRTRSVYRVQTNHEVHPFVKEERILGGK